VGNVKLQLAFFPGNEPSGLGVATFAAPGSVPGALECAGATATAGPCCFVPANPSDAGATSAGTITVDDNGTLFGTFHFGDGGYDHPGDVADPTTRAGWMPGDTLQVTAAGATVPAFSGSVVAPAALENVTPSVYAPTISLSADWTVTWTPSPTTPSMIVFALTAAETAASTDYVKCVLDDAAGTLTVPAALLGHLKPVSFTSITLARTTRTTVGSGLQAVEIVAYSAAEGNAKLVP
jgi:hypothetical protein